MTAISRFYPGCHCERSPAPRGVQGEAKQSLILHATVLLGKVLKNIIYQMFDGWFPWEMDFTWQDAEGVVPGMHPREDRSTEHFPFFYTAL